MLVGTTLRYQDNIAKRLASVNEYTTMKKIQFKKKNTKPLSFSNHNKIIPSDGPVMRDTV